jgi:hypothetical protein
MNVPSINKSSCNRLLPTKRGSQIFARKAILPRCGHFAARLCLRSQSLQCSGSKTLVARIEAASGHG